MSDSNTASASTQLEPLQVVDLNQAVELPAPQPIEPDAKPAPRAKPHTHAHSEPAEPAEPARPTRDDAMRAIAERYEQKVRASELQYAETLSDEAHDRATGQELGTASQARATAVTADDAGDALATNAQPQAQQAVEQGTTAETPSQQPQRFAVSVNGQQYALTQEEILQLADVGGRAMHVLRQQGQAAPQQSQQSPQPQPLSTHVREQQSQRAPAPAPALTIDEPSARELVRRLSFGSEEEAARAIMQVQQGAVDATLAHMRQQQQAPEHIANFATQQALQQIRLEQNLNAIGQEFPDVFNNSRRAQLAALTLHEIRQRDAMLGRGNRSDLDLYREACNTVIAELGISRPATQPQPTTAAAPALNGQQQQPNATQATLQPTVAQQATRAERKRAAPQQPSAVSRAASTDSPKQYPTASEIVERYRKQRGQVPMH